MKRKIPEAPLLLNSVLCEQWVKFPTALIANFSSNCSFRMSCVLFFRSPARLSFTSLLSIFSLIILALYFPTSKPNPNCFLKNLTEKFIKLSVGTLLTVFNTFWSLFVWEIGFYYLWEKIHWRNFFHLEFIDSTSSEALCLFSNVFCFQAVFFCKSNAYFCLTIFLDLINIKTV